MKFYYKIILNLIVTFCYITIVLTCFQSKKDSLDKCITQIIFERELNTENKHNIVCPKDIQNCWISKMRDESLLYREKIHNFNLDLFRGKEINFDILANRYAEAVTCIERIECAHIDQMITSIECCIGENSHFKIPYTQWKNDSYLDYYIKCKKNLLQDILKKE